MKLTLRLRPSGLTDQNQHSAEEAPAGPVGSEGGEQQLSAAIAE